MLWDSGSWHRRGLVFSQEGHSLIELVIAMTVLVMGTGAIIVAFLSSSSLSQSNRETALALDGVHGALERLKGEAFQEVFARYNADPLDDLPLGPSPGSFFAVRGLQPQAGDPDGFVGEILFPGDGFELREDVVDLDLGMSRDLNGDGVISAALAVDSRAAISSTVLRASASSSLVVRIVL